MLAGNSLKEIDDKDGLPVHMQQYSRPNWMGSLIRFWVFETFVLGFLEICAEWLPDSNCSAKASTVFWSLAYLSCYPLHLLPSFSMLIACSGGYLV